MTEPPEKVETMVDMDEFRVIPTRLMRNERNFPGTASVIDAGNIEQKMMRTIKDIVRYEPNLTVQHAPKRSGQWGFNNRGISGNCVLDMVDGLAVPDGFAIGSLFYRFNPNVTMYVGVFNLLNKKSNEWENARSSINGPHSGLSSQPDIRDCYTSSGINVSVTLRDEFGSLFSNPPPLGA